MKGKSGIVEGGSNGQDSIYRALRAADAENDKDAIVLIMMAYARLSVKK